MKIGFFHRNFFNSILGYSQKKFDKIQISKDLPTVIFVSYFSGHNAVKSAIMWAEKHKFLKVFNSHGITPFKVKINSNENIKAPVFDICILNKNSEKNLPYFDKKKTKKIYLAPRFSEEWSSKLLEIYPKKKLKNTKKKKFKIAFILSKWLYKDDKDKILSTIRTTSQIKNTQIIIKPHTRGMVLDEKIPNNVLIADNSYHTRSIIQDSDVIIFTRSSIFLDAILLNKQLIHLSYATNVDLASNALNSCKAFSQEDLIQKLGLIKLGRKIYTQNDRKKCLSTYAGKDNGKMLDNLLREIKAHKRINKLT